MPLIAEPPPTGTPPSIVPEPALTVVPKPLPAIINQALLEAPRAAPVAASAAAVPVLLAEPPSPTPEPTPPMVTAPPTPPQAARALGLLPLPVAGERLPDLLPGVTLHRRASDIIVPPPMQRPARTRWLPVLLSLLAAIAVAYVLINPPGRKTDKVMTAEVAPITPAPVAAVEVPAETAVQLPELIPLPGGTVRLAGTSADATTPPSVRVVRIAPVKIGRTEVTVAQFGDFVRRTGYDNPRWQNYPCESAGGRLPDWQNPGYSQRDESPVVCVSWADANAYTQWLTRQTGQSYRLPTEAEWEYAARAGTSTHYWWGNEFDAGMVACQSCPPKVPTQPAVAAAFPPNPFGLYETLGNVREWTCSRFESYAVDAAESCGSVGEGARVSVRGGSWLQTIDALAADRREAYEPYRRNVWTGFRVAQDIRGVAAAP